jgi:hypothetical protein
LLAVSREYTFYSHLIYSQIVPQTIQVKDTIKCKITGFVLGVACGKALITKSGLFSTFLYIGFNTGRLRMYGNELVNQKNPFFSPKVGLQPKIKLGRLAISFIIEYEYDISNSNWKRTYFSNNTKTNLNSLRQTGITGQLGIGYVY